MVDFSLVFILGFRKFVDGFGYLGRRPPPEGAGWLETFGFGKSSIANQDVKKTAPIAPPMDFSA